MNVTVKFFALGRELTGRSEMKMELPEATTVQALIEQLKSAHPRFAQLNSYLVAVNLEYAELSAPLQEGDEVAIIPPVSGG